MHEFISRSISFDNISKFDDHLPINMAMVPVEENDYFSIGNNYFQDKLPGTLATVYLRAELVKRMQQALRKLPPGYKLHIFDGYRSFATQVAAFQYFLEKIRSDEELSAEDAFAKTCKFFSFPSRERLDAIPHLSGGAVDLCLSLNNKLLDMGTAFDATTELSYTDFFEKPWNREFGIEQARWEMVRYNRRLLFYILGSVGFTNYHHEWWHYDFGDCMWANQKKAKLLFGNAESLVAAIQLRNGSHDSTP